MQIRLERGTRLAPHHCQRHALVAHRPSFSKVEPRAYYAVATFEESAFEGIAPAMVKPI
jgi:hypothetical protein